MSKKRLSNDRRFLTPKIFLDKPGIEWDGPS